MILKNLIKIPPLGTKLKVNVSKKRSFAQFRCNPIEPTYSVLPPPATESSRPAIKQHDIVPHKGRAQCRLAQLPATTAVSARPTTVERPAHKAPKRCARA